MLADDFTTHGSDGRVENSARQDMRKSVLPQDEDIGGWTYVSAKTRRRGGGKSRPSAPSLLSGSGQSVARGESLRPAGDIADEYRRIRSQWETSVTAQTLQHIVADHTPTSVSRAICLGIGTFDPPDGGWDTKRRTFVQLIVFLLLVESLEAAESGTELGKGKIECIFQEPVFTESDKSFITSLGHRVVDSPEGFDMVSPDTLLFGVHLYRPIYAQALARCLPAVFVGSDLEVWDT